jgi:L-threonylcarbamoyladenylate synthase
VIDLEPALEVLERGGLVAFPTETVYGLGADAENTGAVERIFAVKGRPATHPLIVHIGAADQLDAWADAVSAPARRLAEACWPGPLTLVLARHARIPDVVTGGGQSVGLRVPAHPMAQALLEAFAARRADGAAVAAPSANRFGQVSPTTAAHVRADLGDAVDLVLDGGPSQVGVESTIVDCQGSDLEVLRLGGVSLERLAEVLGAAPRLASELRAPAQPDLASTAPVRASGMSAAHYAPHARVALAEVGGDAVVSANRLAARGRVVAVLAPTVLDGLDPDVIELEPAGPAPDYARVLYDRLRQADRLGATDIVAVIPPPGGLGDAVRDRLTRAAR